MRVVDAIANILKLEGVEYLPCYPTTPIIEAAAAAGIRPIVCRQERVGVGMADGSSRVSNGRPPGVFTMQFGPGAEYSFAGVATAHSDSVPLLLLPLGNPSEREGVSPNFSSARIYAPITKSVEVVNARERVTQVMRRAFSQLKMGRPGPVMVEVPVDVALEEVEGSSVAEYRPVKWTCTSADPRDVDEAAAVLVGAGRPVIHAGQGVLYAQATEELIHLSELLQAPVMVTLAGKSAFPESHPLSLGTGSVSMGEAVVHFVSRADVVLGVGSSFTRHNMSTPIPPGKVVIQVTNDSRDINKDYPVDYPVIGDARLVLRQLIEAVTDRLGARGRAGDGSIAQEVAIVKKRWLREWMPKLTSDEVPINPYRVIWELTQTVDSAEAIVTHDSGSPREQMIPFYQAAGPRSYIGWGKSYGLGTGLGLAMGAKLAAPDKLAVAWMGDAAFGMVATDFETAVRCDLPILVLVSNNSIMAAEVRDMAVSHELYGTRNIGGNYAEMARAMGGYSERVQNSAEVAPAINRARRATEDGRAALLEFITCAEPAFSHRRGLG